MKAAHAYGEAAKIVENAVDLFLLCLRQDLDFAAYVRFSNDTLFNLAGGDDPDVKLTSGRSAAEAVVPSYAPAPIDLAAYGNDLPAREHPLRQKMRDFMEQEIFEELSSDLVSKSGTSMPVWTVAKRGCKLVQQPKRGGHRHRSKAA